MCEECSESFEFYNGSCLCHPGYFLNDSLDCESCDWDCLSCESKNLCKICADTNAIPVDGKGCICKEGYWKNESYTNNIWICSGCSKSCKKCVDKNICEECKDSIAILDLNYTCNCPEKFYLDESGFCKDCPENCNSCISENNEI